MPYQSLDQLIASLQQMKADGVPGDAAVVIPSTDNNGRYGFMQRIEGPGKVSVAKADFEKGYDRCKVVSSRGVEVVVIR
jgi:hypothetical protein